MPPGGEHNQFLIPHTALLSILSLFGWEPRGRSLKIFHVLINSAGLLAQFSCRLTPRDDSCSAYHSTPLNVDLGKPAA